jgi:hypothetical protein
MGLMVNPSQEPVTSHPAQVSCPQLIALSLATEVDAPSSALLSSHGNTGEASHVTDLPLDPGQLQPSLAGFLCFFKSPLLGMEVSDAELGVLDVVLAVAVMRNFCCKCPIVLFQEGSLHGGIRNSRPLEYVDEPGGEGNNGVGVVFVLELRDRIDLSDIGLLSRGVFGREPSDTTIGELLDPVGGHVEVVLGGEEKSSGFTEIVALVPFRSLLLGEEVHQSGFEEFDLFLASFVFLLFRPVCRFSSPNSFT